MKKTVFVTFSSKFIKNQSESFASLIKTIDNSQNYKIKYRWFESNNNQQIQLKKLYFKSIKALLSSDIIVADTTIQSTGIGQQIAYGIFHKIPVLIIANKRVEKSSRSKFLKGTSSSIVNFFYYKNYQEIEEKLIKIIDKMSVDPYEKLNFVATRSLKLLLEEKSKKLGITQSELLRQIILDWSKSQKNN